MQSTKISPLAVVSPKAIIGQGVEIGPFAVIEEETTIGDNCVIHPHAMIRNGSTIGKECEIHPHAVIGGIPQDLKYEGEKTQLLIGDRTVIRECVTVNRGTSSKLCTTIGNDCLLMAYAHIAHDCILKNNIIIGNSSQIAGEVEIDDHAILSGGTLVHQFVRISKHVMIQGGSRVTKDIPPYTLVGREPLVYCGINIVGLRRRGFSNDQVYLINDIYRTLFQRGLNNSEALDVIQAECAPSYERDLILDFIKSSNRGIVRGAIE